VRVEGSRLGSFIDCVTVRAIKADERPQTSTAFYRIRALHVSQLYAGSFLCNGVPI
jgi:hypothetical protein